MILSNNISNVYSRGKEISRVYSYGKLVWEKKVEDYNGVIFTAEEANSTIGLAKLSTNQTLEYRTDNTDWQEMTLDTVITLNNIGDRVYIRGELSADNTTSNYTQFTMTGSISANGNCNYIWSKNNLDAPLKAYCGINMFKRTTLITAPELPATILAERCYGDLFAYTPLTQAPELPAKELAPYCYYGMFYSCENLTQAPELPATELAISCYQVMFERCYNLTQAPVLPATTLKESCYRRMFYDCETLTQAPVLPATTLTPYCYYAMFSGSSIIQAPELPATTLVTECYMYMFSRCSKLNYIKCLATDISATNCTNRWVEAVSETGTFIQTEGVDWSVGVNGIPEGWVSVNYSIYYEPFTVKAVDDSVRVKPIRLVMKSGDTGYTMETITYKYSKNGSSEWVETTSDKYINLNKNETLSIISQGVHKVLIEGLSDIYGNIISLAYGDGFEAIDAWYSSVPVGYIKGISNNMKYTGFFSYCDVRDASGLLLPATNLKGCENAYASMFLGCTSLTQAPALPATTLGNACYNIMFNNCTSLTQAPVLPATKLAQSCYSGMFAYCTSLTQAPELPATTLANSCYSGMFAYCTSLTQAPELPASTLKSDCYDNMFEHCSKLSYIKCLVTSVSAWGWDTQSWVLGVSPTGTFVAKNGANWERYENGIPENWTVEYI